MKKFTFNLLFFSLCTSVLISCSNKTPENYFDIAVLNSNYLNGFANNGLSRELESPSVKLVENSTETVPMKRSEVIETKIQFIDGQYDKVKSLKITDDTKDIIEASLALYEFVVPVYKTEYTELANLYDNGAKPEQTEQLTKLIHEKYFPRFDELYKNLIKAGKAYASKHNIKVNWGTD